MKKGSVSTPRDIKNNEIISDIVENHFSLSKESFDYFKEQLFHPDIDDFVYEKLEGNGSNDLRIRYPIDDDMKEQVDKGWKIFNEEFGDFVRHYNVTYDNFINNKVTIENNEYKLNKAVKKFYKENNLFFHNIDHIFNLINDEALPKNYPLEIVVSLNFADWFLSSTGNGWSSCISLENSSPDCYWAGLPGLVGNKNIVMVYLTNGAHKNFEGIITDKQIMRSFCLLTDRNELLKTLWYPHRLINNEEIDRIIKDFNFKAKTMENRNYSPKYDKVDFIYNKEGFTLYPYSDEYIINEDGEVYIKEAGGGFRSFSYKSGNRYTDNIYYTDMNLSNMIDDNQEIINFLDVKEFETCPLCDNEEYIDNMVDIARAYDYIQVCQQCYNDPDKVVQDVFGIVAIKENAKYSEEYKGFLSTRSLFGIRRCLISGLGISIRNRAFPIYYDSDSNVPYKFVHPDYLDKAKINDYVIEGVDDRLYISDSYILKRNASIFMNQVNTSTSFNDVAEYARENFAESARDMMAEVSTYTIPVRDPFIPRIENITITFNYDLNESNVDVFT